MGNVQNCPRGATDSASASEAGNLGSIPNGGKIYDLSMIMLSRRNSGVMIFTSLRTALLGIVITVVGADFSVSKDLISDPSVVPLDMIDSVHFDERSRIRADFNLDGLEDIALSDPLSTIGQSGNLEYTIYLQDSSGLYKELGNLATIWGRLSVEKVGNDAHLWTSGHMGGGETALGYCVIVDTGLVKGDGMVIFPGPAPSISNSIYDAVFDNSDVEIIVEHSRTTNGKVKWLPGRH